MEATMPRPPVEFTPTERKILAVLSDGMMHRREELHACLMDDLAPLTNVQPHISNIRAKIHPRGQDIVCQLYKGVLYYRHVRVLVNPYDGRR